MKEGCRKQQLADSRKEKVKRKNEGRKEYTFTKTFDIKLIFSLLIYLQVD